MLSGLRLSDLVFVVHGIGLAEDTSASSASAASPATDRAPLTSLNLAERTLDACNFVAFVNGLLASMPTFRNAYVGFELPGRCGGSLRLASWCEEDRVLYDMYTLPMNVCGELSGPASVWRETFTPVVKA